MSRTKHPETTGFRYCSRQLWRGDCAHSSLLDRDRAAHQLGESRCDHVVCLASMRREVKHESGYSTATVAHRTSAIGPLRHVAPQHDDGREPSAADIARGAEFVSTRPRLLQPPRSANSGHTRTHERPFRAGSRHVPCGNRRASRASAARLSSSRQRVEQGPGLF